MTEKPLGPKDIEIEEVSPLSEGHFVLNSYRLRHRLFGGGWSEPMTRELLERAPAVAVLAYDPEADSFVMVEQFRLGAHVAGMPAWQTEIIAGLVEEGEEAEEVARRESEEEAGCKLLDLIPIGRYLSSPGATNEAVSFFCARVDSRRTAAEGGKADEHEDIRVSVVPADEALGWIESGRIDNAIAVIALQWFALNRERVRAKWTDAEGSR